MCQTRPGRQKRGNTRVCGAGENKMNATGETNHSTGGTNQTTRERAVARRLAGFIGALLLGIGVVAALNAGTRQRMGQLESEFAAIESERFLLGLHAREAMARMNGALLRFQLSGEDSGREAFRAAQHGLDDRLARTERSLHSAAEREAAEKFKAAYRKYIIDVAELVERPVRGVRKDTAAEVHRLIQEHSTPAVNQAEELVRVQQVAWTEFFAQARVALASLQRLMWISAGVLMIFLALLAALAHRTFISPLRMQLSETQAAIERHEKLASLGILAAGVAHEIRNPLTAIKMRLFSLKKVLPANVAQGEDLAVVNAEINRLERIVKDTLQFARPAEPELGTVATAQLLTELERLLGGELRKRSVTLQVDANDDLLVRADRQQISQVLINLVQNAGESIGQNGSIILSARSGVARLANGSQPVVMIEVADTGRGIPPEAERRLFDPFFSTKEGGTGLGLPIAARIVEKHGGVIQYSSRKNRGATFTIVLPRAFENESTTSVD
jgi:signal transduction histidine kinase